MDLVTVSPPQFVNKYDVVSLVPCPGAGHAFKTPEGKEPAYLLMTDKMRPTMNIANFDFVQGPFSRTIIKSKFRLTPEEWRLIESSTFNIIGLIY